MKWLDNEVVGWGREVGAVRNQNVRANVQGGRTISHIACAVQCRWNIFLSISATDVELIWHTASSGVVMPGPHICATHQLITTSSSLGFHIHTYIHFGCVVVFSRKTPWPGLQVNTRKTLPGCQFLYSCIGCCELWLLCIRLSPSTIKDQKPVSGTHLIN